MDIKNLNVYYGKAHAVKQVNMPIFRNKVTAIIGPSGCGKSTVLRCLNRMNDLFDGTKVDGEIVFNGLDIHRREIDPVKLRRVVGMVFQQPNPFPKSIYENVVYGLRIQGVHNKKKLDEVTEMSLRKAALWDEIKDRLHLDATALSGGQQQRLCIARTIATEPELILMDEPASALDPISTLKIEELINDLKRYYTVVIVTHNMEQAARIGDYTAFFHLGELVEFDTTEKIFTSPAHKQTEDYINGKYG